MSSLLTRADAKVHRCSCGAWLWATNPCTTCAITQERAS